MTGLVAVVAHDRTCPVTASEVDSLASAYEALRGAGQRCSIDASSHTRLIKIDTASADRPGIEVGAQGWAAATGVVHGAKSLIGADLHQLDGQFALVQYDARTDELVVATDPLGLSALYVAERGGRSYISTSALALARHLGARANSVALSMLVACGTQHGPLTCWEGVERLGPATALTFGAGGSGRATYWRPQVDERVAGLGFRHAVDHAIEVLTESFGRHLAGRGRVWADLTGGYDTRLLTLLLQRAGVDFRANTVGAPGAADVRLGRRVARAAGWDWTHLRVPRTWEASAPSRVAPALAWADGRLPVVQLTHVLWIQEQKGAIHRVCLAGGGGEFLRGHAWRQELFRVGRTTHVDYDHLIRVTLLDRDALAVQAGHLVDEVANYLQAVMTSQTEPYVSTRNTTQLDVLMANRKPIWDGIYGSAAAAHVRSELPFLLKPVFETAFSIHYQHRHRRRLVRAMIARLSPRVAQIPTAFGGPTVPLSATNLHLYAPFYGHLGRLAVDKFSQKIFGRRVLASVTTEDPRLQAGRRAILRHLALDLASMRSAPLFNERALVEVLRQAHLPNFAQGELLGRIITVELAIRATEAP